MKKVCISIDVEPDLHTETYNSLKNIPSLLNLFKKYKVRATFFVTCDCVKKNEKLFKKIKSEGHELELHGYVHKRFDDLSKKEKDYHLKSSKKYLKTSLGIVPIGFRAPQHSINEEGINALLKNNFKYDSSLTPWNLYHLLFFWKTKLNFFDNFKRMKIHKEKGILEIPLSSFILPFASITLRVLPTPLLKIYLHLISTLSNPVFLMHSWDITEVKKSKLYQWCPKDKFLKKFEYMLKFFSKRKRFSGMSEIIESNPN